MRRPARAAIAVILSTHVPGHALLCAHRVAALTPALLRTLYGIDAVVAPLPGTGTTVCAPVLA
ncbi:hypothetical protein Q8W71_04105 [Methylobacterium sp. NEAU 140]|uniref:hypothetical protein n=1 Tax=Methylobacterium sp. NEAU 140 TaxID=3064945 RepID=UPI0027340455|nr:hypothetical protein [Methylobacterium sp. NEAU 140]MDP4021800.1 hypothetical protein [Methylobacterium sp. NEAU 140]